MLTLNLGTGDQPLHLLCLGAHSDDLEIGCAGTIIQLLGQHPGSTVTWVVLAANGERAVEARRSAKALLKGAGQTRLLVGGFAEGRFPVDFCELKNHFEQIKCYGQPDVILTHRLEDRHQDHRVTAELTWQTWRDQVVLEYEIPKYEGDLGRPNVYVPLHPSLAARKVRHLMRYFGTQKNRDWFRAETFQATMQLRSIECRAASGFAEAFTARKLVLR